jgi:hypothetical protein
MPSNRTSSPEQHRMITFDGITPDGTRERLRFQTQAEADAAADERREAGHSIYWDRVVREPPALRHDPGGVNP